MIHEKGGRFKVIEEDELHQEATDKKSLSVRQEDVRQVQQNLRDKWSQSVIRTVIRLALLHY